MISYERNFRDDYHHIVDCYKELSEIVENWDGTDIKPNCSKYILESQLDAMYNLLKIMETRADIEGIEL